MIASLFANAFLFIFLYLSTGRNGRPFAETRVTETVEKFIIQLNVILPMFHVFGKFMTVICQSSIA